MIPISETLIRNALPLESLHHLNEHITSVSMQPPDDPILSKFPCSSYQVSQSPNHVSFMPPVDSLSIQFTYSAVNMCEMTDLSSPNCVECEQLCSSAHTCPRCSQPIHVICGYSTEYSEGYGSPVWCMSCWLDFDGRRAAKRGQDKQINRMVRQSVKKARNYDWRKYSSKIPEVDKRSPFDPPNLLGIILSKTNEGYYKLGTIAGILDSQYFPTQFDMCQTIQHSPLNLSRVLMYHFAKLFFVYLLASLDKFANAQAVVTRVDANVSVQENCAIQNAI